jgi:integrase
MTGQRHIGKLTAVQVTREKRPGMYGDGGCLWLQVSSTTAKSWLFRYGGREMGLGSAFVVTLQEARDLAHEYRRQRQQGIDPIEAKRAKVAAAKLDSIKTVTFKECAESFIAANRSGWKSDRHHAQWVNTLAQFAEPIIGNLPVQQIDTTLVLKVLEPIWATIPETAYRLRGRIEAVLDSAKVRGYRTGENPARWRGHLDKILPKVKRVNHHAAMPYAEVPAFIAKLRQQDDVAARALEFCILTAGRSGEILGARWDEIDLDNGVWTIPAERMKAGREHKVPLSPAAMQIVATTERTGALVFSGLPTDSMYNLLQRMKVEATAHGFRSSFSDWSHEQTTHNAHTIEISLAHSVGTEVERAYRRTDLFQKRRDLMNAWGRYCTNAGDAAVVPLRAVTQ